MAPILRAEVAEVPVVAFTGRGTAEDVPPSARHPSRPLRRSLAVRAPPTPSLRYGPAAGDRHWEVTVRLQWRHRRLLPSRLPASPRRFAAPATGVDPRARSRRHRADQGPGTGSRAPALRTREARSRCPPRHPRRGLDAPPSSGYDVIVGAPAPAHLLGKPPTQGGAAPGDSLGLAGPDLPHRDLPLAAPSGMVWLVTRLTSGSTASRGR